MTFKSAMSAWTSKHELAILPAHAEEENRPLVAVIYTLLSSADINVSDSVVILPLSHFLPHLLCS